MRVGEKIKQIRKNTGLQQKAVATDVGLDQSNYNKVKNGKRELSVEILQKLSAILDVTVDELLNSENKMYPTPVTVEDKTVSEKIRPVEQLNKKRYESNKHNGIHRRCLTNRSYKGSYESF